MISLLGSGHTCNFFNEIVGFGGSWDAPRGGGQTFQLGGSHFLMKVGSKTQLRNHTFPEGLHILRSALISTVLPSLTVYFPKKCLEMVGDMG